MSLIEESKGYLLYVLNNCIKAYGYLCKINSTFNEAHDKILRQDFSNSDTEDEYLQSMCGILADYLIVRVACLFDGFKYKPDGNED